MGVSVAQDISTLPRISDLVESKSQRLQNLFQQVSQGFQSKRSVAEALGLLDDAEKQEMADALDVPVSKLSELSEEIADSEKDHHTEEGNSRQKRGLLGLHFLKKHLLGKALVGKALIGTGTALAATGVIAPPLAASIIGAGATAAGTALIGKKLALAATVAGINSAPRTFIHSAPKTVVHSSPRTSVHSVPRTVDVVEKCRNVNKCYQRPVTKCQETPVESCWDEPRGQCTEQRVKVARKWCHVEVPITANDW